MENRVSASLTEENKTTVQTNLTGINTVLDFLKGLSKDERQSLRKMGPATVDFVENALGHARNNPQLRPGLLDFTEFEKDMVLVRDLTNIYIQVEQLYSKLQDTIMLAGSEAYEAARLFYDAVKFAAKLGAPGSVAIYNDLKTAFERS
jgi:hypothetical protein